MSSSASPKKTAARRAPARASRTPSPAPKRKTPSSPVAALKPKAVLKPKAMPKPKAAARPKGGFPVLPVLPVSFVVALVLLGWFMYPIARMHYAEQRKLGKLETQLASIQQRNRKLKREVDRLKTTEGIETAAHELGLARKGEQVWVTVGTNSRASTSTAVPVQRAEVATGVWTQVLDAVFGVGP